MLSTGDVQGCLRKLESLLRVIKYPGYVDYSGLSKGDPSAFLPIVSFTLTSFSPPFAEQLMAMGFELTGKTDLRFTDALYKVLRDIFQYKPILNKQQFLQWGFSQRKISVICDIINLVLQKHNQLKKVSDRPFGVNRTENPSTFPTNTPHVKAFSSSSPENRIAELAGGEEDKDNVLHVSDRPFGVNRTENPSTFPTNTPHVKAFSSSSPENGIAEMAGGEESKDNVLHSSEVEGRLLALEAQLESLSGLHRLSILEKRLEELEKQRNTDKIEGQLISIPKQSWENLMSRVLLLETKLELSNTQLNAPPPCPSSASSVSSSSLSEESKEDLRDSLERISTMLKSTSSLLKNTESSTTPCK
ncbi:centrosomal protein of 44 kDa isoform X2 [Chelmon rostratus]|uniref:centrosomal protein of 44 kDa isoform X2 n=1 Tax=Chelmon rostratus TaxID=109905 RepID=UPI001BE8533E|nr:centrosomal protein of 44 kDa isoform X2 [Chelmon rostratus]